MNQLWDVAVNDLLSGALNLLTAPLYVRGYQNGTFYPTQTTMPEFTSGGTAIATPAVPLANRAVAGRRLKADPATFAALGEAEHIAMLVIYRSDNNRLVAFIDQRPDLAPLWLIGNGGPVEVRWSGPDGKDVIAL